MQVRRTSGKLAGYAYDYCAKTCYIIILNFVIVRVFTQNLKKKTCIIIIIINYYYYYYYYYATELITVSVYIYMYIINWLQYKLSNGLL